LEVLVVLEKIMRPFAPHRTFCILNKEQKFKFAMNFHRCSPAIALYATESFKAVV